ncbi:STAS domain-containing protein [Streptomyces cadmiisoli]|uniref:STAS domain-containing protein n=1 Tax=Streptomyces cadmiisoli TaxID=2184053 RepID=UPI003647A4F5
MGRRAPSGSEGTAAGLTAAPLAGPRGVRAAGEVGLTTRDVWDHVLDQLDRIVREGEEVCHLELSAVTFVDVAGAGALAEAARRLPDGHRIVLHGPPSALCRTLELFWPDLPAIEVSVT